MASPTSHETHAVPKQTPTHGITPGVGLQGAPPRVEPLPPPDPVLWEDIDPVLLIRLYPAAKDAAELRSQAMAAGELVRAEAAELIASQQEPVAPLPEGGAPPPRPQPSHGATGATGSGEAAHHKPH